MRAKITRALYCATATPLCQLFAHAQMIRVKGDRELDWEERPRTRMSDPTLATENEIDREDSNRELGMEATKEWISRMSQ